MEEETGVNVYTWFDTQRTSYGFSYCSSSIPDRTHPLPNPESSSGSSCLQWWDLEQGGVAVIILISRVGVVFAIKCSSWRSYTLNIFTLNASPGYREA
jgi:hypothetical protein